MKKQLDAQALFDMHINQAFSTLDEQFESFQQVALQIIHEQQTDLFIVLFGNYSEPFILFGDHYKVLQFFYDVEQRLQLIEKAAAERMLAILYLIIGHCYYMQLNKKLAKSYYKKSSSLAFQQGLYNVLSITVNNVTVLNYDVVSDELLFEDSHLPAIFFLLKQTKDHPFFIYRMHTHVEMAIRTKRFDYAEALFKHYFEQTDIDEQSRFGYQIKVLKADLLFGQGHYEQAQKLYHDTLMHNIMGDQLKDLILHCYQQLAECDCMLNAATAMFDYTASSATYLQEAQSSTKKIERYFQRHPVQLQASYVKEKESFRQLAEPYFSQEAADSYTLVIIELKIATEPLENDVIALLSHEMTVHFCDTMMEQGRLDAKTVAYVIALSEEQVDTTIRHVFAAVRQQFPRETSGLDAIYYAAIHKKANGAKNYAECYQLAYAYLYYEYYK